MKPKRVVSTLLQKDLPSSSKVSSIQPLEVYHHATFLVDLEVLPSTQDIKCDDVGNWRNNSNDRCHFSLEWMEDNSARLTAAEPSDTDVATLKREYYMLKHYNDFRKRIDFLYREWITLFGHGISPNDLHYMSFLNYLCLKSFIYQDWCTLNPRLDHRASRCGRPAQGFRCRS